MTDQLEPPCEDPTCNCCNVWRGLDDQRQARIAELEAAIDLHAKYCPVARNYGESTEVAVGEGT